MNTQTQDNSLQALIADLEENAKRLQTFNATGPAYRQKKYASALKAMDKNTAQHFAETLVHHELEPEALEQPAQEPVAWMNDIAFSMDKELLGTRSRIVPLYTHPAPSWQGLTEDEILEIPVGSRLSTARSIEQALKEKNT